MTSRYQDLINYVGRMIQNTGGFEFKPTADNFERCLQLLKQNWVVKETKNLPNSQLLVTLLQGEQTLLVTLSAWEQRLLFQYIKEGHLNNINRK